MVKQRFNITAAVCHAKNQHVRILDTIHDDLLANGKTPRANAELIVTGAAQVGLAGKKKKPAGDGIDQPVGNINAAAFLGNVIPDIDQVGGGLRRYAVRH
jgi:hypothetical protein